MLVLAAGGDGIHIEATLLVDTEREVCTPLLGLLPLPADNGQLLHHHTLQLGRGRVLDPIPELLLFIL